MEDGYRVARSGVVTGVTRAAPEVRSAKAPDSGAGHREESGQRCVTGPLRGADR
jgi:hypothetical protein